MCNCDRRWKSNIDLLFVISTICTHIYFAAAVVVEASIRLNCRSTTINEMSDLALKWDYCLAYWWWWWWSKESSEIRHRQNEITVWKMNCWFNHTIGFIELWSENAINAILISREKNEWNHKIWPYYFIFIQRHTSVTTNLKWWGNCSLASNFFSAGNFTVCSSKNWLKNRKLANENVSNRDTFCAPFMFAKLSILSNLFGQFLVCEIWTRKKMGKKSSHQIGIVWPHPPSI